jgi:hypothetical protein
MLFAYVTVASTLFIFAKLPEDLFGMSSASCVLLIVRFSVCLLGADFGRIKAVPEFVDRWCGQLYTRTTEITQVFFFLKKIMSSAFVSVVICMNRA